MRGARASEYVKDFDLLDTYMRLLLSVHERFVQLRRRLICETILVLGATISLPEIEFMQYVFQWIMHKL